MLSLLLKQVSGCWDDLMSPNTFEQHFHFVTAAAVTVGVIVVILLATKILGGGRRSYDQDVVLITGGLPPFSLPLSPRWLILTLR